MKFLVTGGAGYIGSTICSALEDAGHTPVILDSLITGREEFTRNKIFYRGDIADDSLVRKLFQEHPDIYATVHCAALIVVPESVTNPYEYYQDNVSKSIEFFNSLQSVGQKRVVFSSSASLYDVVPGFMVTEEAPILPSSPYARTKFMMEMILKDFCTAYCMKGIALRYFNPIGADPKMRSGIHVPFPTHVLGKLVDTAQGKQEVFEITGNTWPTRDGKAFGFYIHVWNWLWHLKCLVSFCPDAFRAARISGMVTWKQPGTVMVKPCTRWSRMRVGIGSTIYKQSERTAPDQRYCRLIRPVPTKPGNGLVGNRNFP